MDSDGKGGGLEFFSIHADRTRLRWVIEETDIEAVLPTPTILRSVEFRNNVQTNLYNLQGMPLNQQPSSGVYLERTTDDDGNVSIKKKMAQ